MITWIKANPIATLFIVAAIIGIVIWIRRNYRGTNGDEGTGTNDRVQEEESPNTIVASNSNMMQSMANMGQMANMGSMTNSGARTTGGKANG